jgi:hypothetical protein
LARQVYRNRFDGLLEEPHADGAREQQHATPALAVKFG